MAQNTDAMDAEQNAEISEGDYVRINEDSGSFPGRVGEVENVRTLSGTTVASVRVDGGREATEYSGETLDVLGEWASVASSRVRSFVADARHAEQIGSPDVLKAGDVGAILAPEFKNGRMSGRVFEVADRYGFEVAEVNFNEETVLFQDSARTE